MNNYLNILQQRINNRPVVIMLHGKSIEGFENYIEELKDLNICYTSINYFDLLENHILSKINKTFDFVFDSAGIIPSSRIYYNKNIRIPRLQKYLNKNKKNIWITDRVTVSDLAYCSGGLIFLKKYREQTIIIDYDIGLTLNVANSTILLIGLCEICKAKKIIICGMDGYKGKNIGEKIINSYAYNKEFIKHLNIATASMPTNIYKDSNNFEHTIKNKLKEYSKQYNVKIPEIVNCSSISIHKVFPKIKYEGLKKWLI